MVRVSWDTPSACVRDEERAPTIRYENNYLCVFSLIKNYYRIVRWKIFFFLSFSVSIWGSVTFYSMLLCKLVIQVQFQMMMMMAMVMMIFCRLGVYMFFFICALLQCKEMLENREEKEQQRERENKTKNTNKKKLFQKPQLRSIEWPTNISCVFVDIIIDVVLL